MKKYFKHILLLVLLLQFVPQPAHAASTTPMSSAINGVTDTTYSFYGIGAGDYIKAEPIGTFKKLCTVAYKETTDSAGNTTGKSGVLRPGHITGNVVRCAENVIAYGADAMVNTIILKFSYLVFYSVTLAIIFHAIRMMFGMANHHGVTMMLVVKIVLVLYFCSPIGFIQTKLIRNSLIEFPKSVAAAIIAMPPANGSILDYGEFFVKSIGVETLVPDEYFCADRANHPESCIYKNPLSDFYDQFDVMIQKTLGIAPDKAGNDDQVKNPFMGIVAALVGLFFAGPMGLMLAMFILTYVLTFVFAAAELILYFVAVAIVINFLVALTPLALACLLFEPTIRITKLWFGTLIIYAFQPIILAVFIVFTMGVVLKTADNTALTFKNLKLKMQNVDGKSIVKTSIIDCNQYTGNSNAGPSRYSKSDFWINMSGKVAEQAMYNYRSGSGTLSAQDYQASASSNNCMISSDTILLNDGTVALTEEQKSAIAGYVSTDDIRSLMANLFAEIMMMFLLISFIKEIPSLVNQLMGAGATSINSYITITDNTLGFVENTGNFVGQAVRRSGVTKF